MHGKLSNAIGFGKGMDIKEYKIPGNIHVVVVEADTRFREPDVRRYVAEAASLYKTHVDAGRAVKSVWGIISNAEIWQFIFIDKMGQVRHSGKLQGINVEMTTDEDMEAETVRTEGSEIAQVKTEEPWPADCDEVKKEEPDQTSPLPDRKEHVAGQPDAQVKEEPVTMEDENGDSRPIKEEDIESDEDEDVESLSSDFGCPSLPEEDESEYSDIGGGEYADAYDDCDQRLKQPSRLKTLSKLLSVTALEDADMEASKEAISSELQALQRPFCLLLRQDYEAFNYEEKVIRAQGIRALKGVDAVRTTLLTHSAVKLFLVQLRVKEKWFDLNGYRIEDHRVPLQFINPDKICLTEAWGDGRGKESTFYAFSDQEDGDRVKDVVFNPFCLAVVPVKALSEIPPDLGSTDPSALLAVLQNSVDHDTSTNCNTTHHPRTVFRAILAHNDPDVIHQAVQAIPITALRPSDLVALSQLPAWPSTLAPLVASQATASKSPAVELAGLWRLVAGTDAEETIAAHVARQPDGSTWVGTVVDEVLMHPRLTKRMKAAVRRRIWTIAGRIWVYRKELSWEIPEAVFPESKEIEEFLRGDIRTMEVTCSRKKRKRIKEAIKKLKVEKGLAVEAFAYGSSVRVTKVIAAGHKKMDDIKRWRRLEREMKRLKKALAEGSRPNPKVEPEATGARTSGIGMKRKFEGEESRASDIDGHRRKKKAKKKKRKKAKADTVDATRFLILLEIPPMLSAKRKRVEVKETKTDESNTAKTEEPELAQVKTDDPADSTKAKMEELDQEYRSCKKERRTSPVPDKKEPPVGHSDPRVKKEEDESADRNSKEEDVTKEENVEANADDVESLFSDYDCPYLSEAESDHGHEEYEHEFGIDGDEVLEEPPELEPLSGLLSAAALKRTDREVSKAAIDRELQALRKTFCLLLTEKPESPTDMEKRIRAHGIGALTGIDAVRAALLDHPAVKIFLVLLRREFNQGDDRFGHHNGEVDESGPEFEKWFDLSGHRVENRHGRLEFINPDGINHTEAWGTGRSREFTYFDSFNEDGDWAKEVVFNPFCLVVVPVATINRGLQLELPELLSNLSSMDSTALLPLLHNDGGTPIKPTKGKAKQQKHLTRLRMRAVFRALLALNDAEAILQAVEAIPIDFLQPSDLVALSKLPSWSSILAPIVASKTAALPTCPFPDDLANLWRLVAGTDAEEMVATVVAKQPDGCRFKCTQTEREKGWVANVVDELLMHPCLTDRMKAAVRRRIRTLEGGIRGCRERFSWRIPEAVFAENNEIEEFLRGDGYTMTVPGDFKEGRRLEEALKDLGVNRGLSVTTNAWKEGVKIEKVIGYSYKTKGNIVRWRRLEKEMMRLKAALGEGSGTKRKREEKTDGEEETGNSSKQLKSMMMELLHQMEQSEGEEDTDEEEESDY
ncbi:hypothetical protein HDU96_010615 [Phlyctochytrium bullatum]|nr:hypothetical protein HDU96_010615 [Phlyctochytrium bullatum]